jgi:hypothetical protein
LGGRGRGKKSIQPLYHIQPWQHIYTSQIPIIVITSLHHHIKTLSQHHVTTSHHRVITLMLQQSDKAGKCRLSLAK